MTSALLAVQRSGQDYPDNSVYTYTVANHISTPVPFRIDLAKSTLLQKSDGADEMPFTPVPPHTVAEVVRITTNRSTLLIAVVKQVCRGRLSNNGIDIADVQLLDDSLKSEHLAVVTVSVFGKEKIKVLQNIIGNRWLVCSTCLCLVLEVRLLSITTQRNLWPHLPIVQDEKFDCKSRRSWQPPKTPFR